MRRGRAYRLSGRVCLVAAAAASGCGAAPSPSAGGPSTTWTASVPAIASHTLDEALAIIGSDHGAGPDPLPIGELSAAVFARGVSRPDTTTKQWQDLVTGVCGDGGAKLRAALDAGWDLTLSGFVDSTGSVSINDALQDGRAIEAGQLLGAACGVPPGRIRTAKGGVAGPGAEARKVTVLLTRTPASEAK